MKNLIIICIFSSVLTFAHAHDDEKHNITEVKNESFSKEKLELVNFNWNKEVKSIFVRSCFDCHSDKTKYPWYYKIPGVKQLIDHDIDEAREHIDFSKGFPFTGKSRRGGIIKMLSEIQEEIEENGMPDSMYLFMHSEAKLSTADKNLIYSWIKKSKTVLAE